MEEEDWRAWQSFLVQWGLVFTLMLVALVLLPYILKSLGYAVRCHATTEPPPHHRSPLTRPVHAWAGGREGRDGDAAACGLVRGASLQLHVYHGAVDANAR